MVRNKNDNSFYPEGENKLIRNVFLVGFDSNTMPSSVTNSITGEQLSFNFDRASNALIVKDIDLPIQLGEMQGPIEILEFSYD